MNKVSKTRSSNAFMAWPNLVLTPLIQLITLVLPIPVSLKVHHYWDLSFFSGCLVYLAIVGAFTIIILRLLVLFFPFQAGNINGADEPWRVYRWNLWSHLYSSNLYMISDNILIPPMFRKVFLQLLGAKMGGGIMLICAKIGDPAMLEVQEGAVLGEGSLIVSHLISPPNKLMLGKVIIKKRAVVGAMSFISPGVTIGENALVKIGSIVMPNTTIGPGEIWGGNPAVKISNANTNIQLNEAN
jgi:hypothetical protein